MGAQIIEHGSTPSRVAQIYVGLVLVNAVHALAFFTMLSDIGAVGSALMKGVQAVSVFTLSATFFCNYESSQCFSPLKATSMGVVLVGTSCYSIAKWQADIPK